MPKEFYFFDSYAIIQILAGAESYRKYTTADFIITQLNIFEVYYCLLRDFGVEKAESFLKDYYEHCVSLHQAVLCDAAHLRLQFKKRNLSMTDCIGYIIAKRWGIKFLTGDKEFSDMENMEFVK